MNDSIVVTLTYGSLVLGDYALPSAVPLQELCPRLLSTLASDYKKLFSDCKAIVLSANDMQYRQGTASLSDYGILDGAKLNVVADDYPG